MCLTDIHNMVHSNSVQNTTRMNSIFSTPARMCLNYQLTMINLECLTTTACDICLDRIENQQVVEYVIQVK